MHKKSKNWLKFVTLRKKIRISVRVLLSNTKNYRSNFSNFRGIKNI